MLKANKNLMTMAIIGAITTTLLLTTSQGIAHERGHKGNQQRKAVAQFKRLDANDDRVLEVDELTVPALNKAERKFNRKDADADGFLTYEEATAGHPERKDLSSIAEEIVQCVADIKEETGNENIIVPDVDKFSSPRDKFDNVDTSNDSLLDLPEVRAMATNKAKDKFTTMDTDENDQVSLEEFMRHKLQRHTTRRVVKSCIDELLDDEGV